MNKVQKYIYCIVVCFVLSTLCLAGWDNTKPADNQVWNLAAGDIRDNWDALEVVFGTNLDGAHPYYQADAPTQKPDASTTLDANDNGRLWVDSDDGQLYYYVYAASGTVWWPTHSHFKNIEGYGAVPDDGVDDTDEIQAAISACSSGEGLIVPAGTFNISSALNVITSNIKIFGVGKASLIKTSSTTAHVFCVIGQNTYPNDARGVKICNLSIQGPDSGTGAGIYVENAHDCIFTNLWISDHSAGLGYGIYFNGAGSGGDTDNNIISNNIIQQTVHTGIYLWATDPLTVEENTIRGNVITGPGNNGIGLTGQKNTIIGNTIEESTNRGIVIGDGDYNTITGNTCCECKKSGISIESVGSYVYGNIVANNICKDNDVDNTKTYHGINLRNTKGSMVIGNSCRDNDGYEISLNAGCTDNFVAFNDVYGTDHEDFIKDLGARNHVMFNYISNADYVQIDDNLKIEGGMIIQDVVTIAADDTTPDVSGGNIFVTSANTGATAITDLDNPQVGQIIYLIGGSATYSSTIADSGNFALSASWTATVDEVLVLFVQADNDYIELSRSTN